MILGLHHAQITIPNGQEDEARQFYCKGLRLKEISKPQSLQGRGGIWVEVGNQQVHIGTEDGVERMNTKAHLAYLVNDINEMQEWIKTNHIEIYESVPIPGYLRFEIRDPFGNRVEFIQPA